MKIAEQNLDNFNPAEWKAGWYDAADQHAKLNFRNWLQKTLMNERMNVTFTKADGTDRHMHCTLNHELVPSLYDLHEDVNKTPEAKQARAPNLEVLSVWDLDKAAWRSFRLDKIKYFSYNLGELHI